MSRYDSIDRQEEQRRGRVLDTVFYPTSDELTEGNTTMTRAEVGDRLDNLAQEFYGDPTLWWVIARANELEGSSLTVEPGTQLIIPRDIGAILNKHQNLNR